MAEVSRQEFADLCGDDVKLINVYINRKKIIVGPGGVDTKNPINKAFITKRKAANAQKKEDKQVIARIPVNKIKPAKDDFDSEQDSEPLPEPLTEEAIATLLSRQPGGRGGKGNDDEGLGKWIKMKMRGDAELVSLRVEREQLLLDKAAGRLMPIELVTDIHKRYASNIFNHFENGVENMAVKFCQMVAGGDMAKYTAFMEECRRELARCIGDAGKETDEDIVRLITDYAETRYRGEKKI